MVIVGSGELASTEGTTQGDPLAMAMYALAVTPLIHQLRTNSPDVCSLLQQTEDLVDLTVLGPKFGYYPNGSKTHLVVKPEHEETARQLFTDTDVNISIEGKRHLGAALGSRTFTEEYVTNKVQGWTQEITRLAEIGTTQPHAAYATFTHGLSSRWSYISRTIPVVHDLLLPLETAIHQCLIPALTGRAPCSRQERDLLALPVGLGGLGLTNPATNSSHAFQASERLTAP